MAELRSAFEILGDPLARLIHEFFWLWDDDGPHDAAVRTHCAALENYAPEDFTPADIDELRTGRWPAALRDWARTLADPATWDHLRDRIEVLDDPRLPPNILRHLRSHLSRHIIAVHVDLAAEAARRFDPLLADHHLLLLDRSPLRDDDIDVVLEAKAHTARSQVLRACERARTAAADRSADPAVITEQLHESSRPPLQVMMSLLGTGNPAVHAATTRVAKTAARCTRAHYTGIIRLAPRSGTLSSGGPNGTPDSGPAHGARRSDVAHNAMRAGTKRAAALRALFALSLLALCAIAGISPAADLRPALLLPPATTAVCALRLLRIDARNT